VQVKGLTKAFILMAAAASGAASFLYQAVWMRRLALIFGSTTFVTVTTISAFLGGFAVGAWILGRLADRRPRSSLMILAALELAAGGYGLASFWILHGVEALYLLLYPPFADRGIALASAQFVLPAVVILPSAVLMGGLLALVARVLHSNGSEAVGSAGAVYGWSTLGAAFGGVMAIYGLLPAVGLTSTVLLAIAINVLVSAAAFWVEMRSRQVAKPLNAAVSMPVSDLGGESSDIFMKFLVLQAFAISGLALVLFQAAWVRSAAMVMGSSIYVYGAWIVVVLTGTGIGSILYSRVPRPTAGHQRWLEWLEFLLALTAALAMIFLPRLPYLFARFFPLFRNSFGRQIAAQFLAMAIGALLPALFFGAIFAAVMGSLGAAATCLGGMMGAAFIVGTIGVTAGAWLAEFAFLPGIGLEATMKVGVLASVSAGFPLWWRSRVPKLRRAAALSSAAAALLVAALLPPWPRETFAAGIGFIAPRLGPDETLSEIVKRTQLLFYRDGRTATISVDETGPTRFLRSNGKTVGSTDPVDMASQLLLGHLPMLLHQEPRNILILGLTTGLTAAAVARYPAQRIDIVEPEPAVARAARLFDSYTRNLLDDSRVHLMIGDGRNRLLVMPQQYDVVISEASDVWVAGAGSPATREFYRIVGARLNPGGIFAQSIHTQGLLPDDLDFLAATFHSVFPHMQMWTSAPGNLILLGTRDSVAWDYTRLQRHFAEIQGVAPDLKSIGIWRPFALFGAQILGESESDTFTREIDELNTDDRPTLEFRVPRSLYVETTSSIAKELNPFRRPDALAIGGFDPQRDLDADGTYLLGFAYASMGQNDLAIRYMERSTAMAPDRAMFLVGLANQYRAAGRIPDARGAYERALKLDLNNVEALVSLGEIRLDEGQLEWTRVLSERALQLAPQDARVHDLIDRLQDAER
jgi:spermidine synthase